MRTDRQTDMTKLIAPFRNFANATFCKTSQYRIPEVLYFILKFSHMPRVKHGIEGPILGALRMEGGRKWYYRTQFPHYELHDPFSFSNWRISSWSRYRTAGLDFPCRIRNADYSTQHNEEPQFYCKTWPKHKTVMNLRARSEPGGIWWRTGWGSEGETGEWSG